MSLRNIGIVYRKEMVDSLRDRRTVISMVVVPILLMPLMTLGMAGISIRMMNKAKEEVPPVMIFGGEDSPRVTAALQKLSTVQFVSPSSDYVAQISNKQIRAAVLIPAGF